jgi:lysophospholipase L1-like esterase
MSYLAEITALLRVDWPDNRAVNIVCHGHSVPAGYFKTPVVDSLNSYPHLLRAGLAARFPHAVINVIVTAIGGETSERGAARFEREVLCHRPDVLTIDYALNDRRLGLEGAHAAWTTMIEQALVRNIKVLLLTPTADTTANLDDPNDPLNQHADQVRALAAKYHLLLVDTLAATKAALKRGVRIDDLMSQHNHPNRAGHEIVATEMLRVFD